MTLTLTYIYIYTYLYVSLPATNAPHAPKMDPQKGSLRFGISAAICGSSGPKEFPKRLLILGPARGPESAGPGDQPILDEEMVLLVRKSEKERFTRFHFPLFPPVGHVGREKTNQHR